MIVSELSPKRLRAELRGAGLAVEIGPFTVRVRSRAAAVAAGIEATYRDYPVGSREHADFHVGIAGGSPWRRWLRPQARFELDGLSPFLPLPAPQAFAALEWGLNWTFGNHCHRFLIVHAAVAERGGRAVVMPGHPGSGKSTLCAAMTHHGWRLLSDELALIDPYSLSIMPLPRPISLKNESVAVIRGYCPGAHWGPEARDTLKGTIRHLRPPVASVQRAREPATPAVILFPRYEHDAPAAELSPFPPGRALLRLAENAFNYHVHGLAGFEALGRIVESCLTRELRYSDLATAVAGIEGLTEPPRRELPRKQSA